MPNWCVCKLRIKGSKSELERFIELAKTGKQALDANNFIPYPKRFNDITKKSQEHNKKKNGKYMKDGFNSGGYEWCIKNWGTKWNFCTPEMTRNSRSVLYTFETAWSPPCPLIWKMAKMFPKLTFIMRYWEGGMAFKGIFECKSGEIVKDESSKYFGFRGG